MDIEKGHLKAFFFEFGQGVEHGMVFERSGNDVGFAVFFAGIGSGNQGLVIGLTAAGGKGDFCRVGI